MKQSKVLYGLAVIFCIFPLITACDYLPGFIVGDTDRGFVALQFSLAGENVMDAASVKLELSSDGSSSEFVRTVDIDTGSNSAYAFIPEVPTGFWNVAFTVFNSADGVVISDSPGDSFQVMNGEILTLEVTYDTAGEGSLTIDSVSASTIEPAVDINEEKFDVTLVLFRDGDFNYDIQNITRIYGEGNFQAASGFSFIYPDGTTVSFSQRSILGESEITITDTSFTCMQSSFGWGSGGTYEVRVTDQFGISASVSEDLEFYNSDDDIAYCTYPAQGDAGSFDTTIDTSIEWDPLDDTEIQSIIVLLVEKSMLTSSPPDFVSPPLTGSATSVTVPWSTGLIPGIEYKLILLTFDKEVTDTSGFSAISNLSPESLLSDILSSPDYDFDFIGMSYSSFITKT